MQELEMEVLRTTRGTCPLALAVFAPSGESKKDAQTALPDCIAANTIACDTLGALPDAGYALVLPGANTFKAQAIAERIIDELESAQGSARAGIACLEGKHELAAEQLLDNALTALRQIMESPIRVKLFREKENALSMRKTLVHSNEKRFLFSGAE